jgi:hypothetical protein
METSQAENSIEDIRRRPNEAGVNIGKNGFQINHGLNLPYCSKKMSISIYKKPLNGVVTEVTGMRRRGQKIKWWCESY